MLTPRELARSLWPEFGEVFVVDLVLSLCVIMVALAACISAGRTILFKARLTEVMSAAEARRIDVVEALALTGELEQVQSTTNVRTSHESFLSGEQMQKPLVTSKTSIFDTGQRAKESSDKRAAKEMGGSSTYVTGVQVVGSALIVAGKIDGREFEYVERPAFPDEDTPFTYVWLCGSRRAPDGWIAMAAPQASQPLPPQLQYSRCRAGAP
jgi:hypothetical protein